MKVRYSRGAALDLASIEEYLSEYGRRGAVDVLAAIYVAIEFIHRNPNSAEKTTIVGVNAKIVKKYRYKLFYRVLEREETMKSCIYATLRVSNGVGTRNRYETSQQIWRPA